MFTRNHMLGVLAVAATMASASAFAQSQPIASKDFDHLQQMIKPAVDESRWLGMAWLTSVHEARQQAAAEGKPILLWSGGGAPPLGGC